MQKVGHVTTSSWRVPAFPLVVTSWRRGGVEVVMTKLTHLGPFEPRVRRMRADIPLAQSNQRTRRTRTGVLPMSNAVIVGPRYGSQDTLERLRLT